MRTDDLTAIIVIDNSSEITELLARAVFAILHKREGYAFKQPLPVAGVKLEEYAGRYSPQPCRAWPTQRNNRRSDVARSLRENDSDWFEAAVTYSKLQDVMPLL